MHLKVFLKQEKPSKLSFLGKYIKKPKKKNQKKTKKTKKTKNPKNQFFSNPACSSSEPP
jgi:hypothetical protein